MRISDWSSDVCSSDLTGSVPRQLPFAHPPPPPPPPPHAVARQSGRVWSRARCEHHPDELGKVVRLHLLHHPRAMDLDRPGADPQPEGEDRKSTRLNSSH